MLIRNQRSPLAAAMLVAIVFAALLGTVLGAGLAAAQPVNAAPARQTGTGVATDTAASAITATSSATETAAVTAATATTATVSETPAPAPSLPAPIYYLDGTTDQIVRLEADGTTRRAVTHEIQPITAFDVSPDGARLVYVVGNNLVETDAAGLQRTVKVTGQPYDPTDAAAAIAQRIDSPVYSPDGSRIAFGLNGVNVIASGFDAGVQPQLLLASSAYPAEGGAPGSNPPRFYTPREWSPDGARLVVQIACYPEAGGLALLDPASGALTELASTASDVPMIGDIAWRPDSSGFFIGSNLLAYGSPGMSYVNAADGTVTGVLTTTAALDVGAANPIFLVRGPHMNQANDTLWAFIAEQTDLGAPAAYQLDSVDAANSTRTPIGSATYQPDGDVLWARDDSGALIQSGIRADANGVNGTLYWVPSTGGEAAPLAAFGRMPRWGSAEAGSSAAEVQQVVALFDQSINLAAAQTNTETQAFGPSTAFPVTAPDGNTYWVAQTTGLRSFAPDVPHAIGIYAREGDQWRELSILQLVGSQEGVTAGPDYLGPDGVMPTTIDDKNLWLHVEGGAGAHGGACEIVRFDGQTLTQELDAFSASPGACTIQDVNGDGVNEVVENATDAYVFCYACGVRQINYTVQRWVNDQFEQVNVEPLPADAPEALNTLNDQMLRGVQGGLWKSALDLASQQPAETDPSGVFDWNRALVRLTGEARRDYAAQPENPYPLLAQVFYGDYPAAVDVMRAFSATAVFTQPSALITGTVAEGWEAALSSVLTTTTSAAIGVNPQLAAAYFVRGFGEWLADPASQAAADDVRKAADLKPDDALFAESVTALTGEARTPTTSTTPITDTSRLTPTIPVTPTAPLTLTAPLTPTAPVTSTAPVTGSTVTTNTAGATGRLFYSANTDGVDRIYMLRFGEQNATLDEVVAQGRQPALQPGGVRLAFQSTASDQLGLGGYDLDSGLRVNFTTNLEDSLPRWNPADGKLAFSSTRYGDGRSRVYTVWPDGRSEALDLGEGSDPDWSPDGGRLVYKGCDTQGANCGLWTMNADGSDRRSLTNNGGDSRPRWSPDGARVVFMSDQRSGNWDVYSVAVNGDGSGGEVTQITFNAAVDGLPALSPDGSEIVFLSNRGNRWGLWRVSITSGRAQSILGDLGALPNWQDEGLDWVK